MIVARLLVIVAAGLCIVLAYKGLRYREGVCAEPGAMMQHVAPNSGLSESFDSIKPGPEDFILTADPYCYAGLRWRPQ